MKTDKRKEELTNRTEQSNQWEQTSHADANSSNEQNEDRILLEDSSESVDYDPQDGTVAVGSGLGIDE